MLRSRPWYPRYRLAHARLFALAALAAAAAGFLLPAASLELQLALLAGGVGLLGLPHGAADPWLVAERRGRLGFAVAYAGVGGAVVALWWLAPGICLAVFLAVSVLHFGLEDREPGLMGPAAARLEVLCRGALPVAGAMLFHPAETAALFEQLAPGAGAAVSAGWERHGVLLGGVWLAGLAGVSLLHTALYWRWRDPRHAAAAAEMGALLLAFAALPPLLAFGLYFCVGHSPRHALRMAADLDARDPARALGGFALRAAPLTLLTVAAAGAAWLLLSGGVAPQAAAVRVIFAGLAALTAPHLLVAGLAGRSGAALGGAEAAPARA